MDAARVFVDWYLASAYGCIDVPAAEVEPAACGSDSGQDIPVYAFILHVLAGSVPGRTCDLLGMEQHAVNFAAVGDHAADGNHW